jgi:hypothetical protein
MREVTKSVGRRIDAGVSVTLRNRGENRRIGVEVRRSMTLTGQHNSEEDRKADTDCRDAEDEHGRAEDKRAACELGLHV